MINIYNIFARMKFWGILLYSALVCNLSLFSQAPVSYSSPDIYQRIKKLKVLGTVLYVAAHPDDENTRLLSWLSKDQLLRTGYLSFTRGDGGQNLIGDEQGIELGLIRTQELLAARRIDGAEQFFSRAFDFGYSKSTEEALRIWNEEKILADAVWVIRKFQPDVIITRFPPDNRAGHGHHSASAVLAKEAFIKAADPNAFPSQFKYGVKPWKTTRILWNNYNFGGVNTTSEDQLKIDVGGFNPVLGKSYGEIAAESRSQHKSQGFGVPAARGTQTEYFSHTDGSKANKTLTEGINIGWNRTGAPEIATAIDVILKQYILSNPSASVPALVKLYKDISHLPDSHWRTVKLQELLDIIAACSGLWMEAYTTENSAVQGSPLNVNISINNRSAASVRIKNIQIDQSDTIINKDAISNNNLDFSWKIPVPADKPVSQPYWLAAKMNGGSFNINDQLLIGKPQSEPSFMAIFNIAIGKQDFQFARPVRYKHTDPVKGEIYQPLAVVTPAGKISSFGTLKHIHYEHIPDISYFNSDTLKITLKDVRIASKKIGYIEGAGDKVPAALALMGYDVTILKEKNITPAFLEQFDAVVTGVRAYNVNSFLTEKNETLNEYVKNGGNLVVQYNTNSNAGPIRTKIGPYSFTISRGRITDESSPVTFSLPAHPVFNYPNKITATDFEGWVQERSIYLADQLDPVFVTPLSMKDPGEESQQGSLIIANYGKGTFVYTGIVFFRELPAGVNGAYRILANIIALNKKNNE